MIKKELRIAFLTSDITYGGAARSLKYLLQSIREESFKIYVFSRGVRGNELVKEIQNFICEFELININQINCNQSYVSKIGHFKKEINRDYNWFIDKLIEKKIDILHVNTTVFAQLLKQIKIKTNIKIVVHLRENIIQCKNSAIKNYVIEQISKYADCLISISNNEIIPFVTFINKYVLPNPLDFKEVEEINSNFRKEYGISEDTSLIGMLGNVTKSKGQLEFLKLIESFKNKYETKKIKFIIVGFPSKKPVWKIILKRLLFISEYTHTINNFIKKNKLESYIITIPATNNVFPIIKELDIIIRPSLAGDPWGRDIIEAMAFKKPVVATGVSDFYIENGINGYLVPVNNIKLILEKLLYLINNHAIREKFGSAGFKKIYSMCNINHYGMKLTSIYYSLF